MRTKPVRSYGRPEPYADTVELARFNSKGRMMKRRDFIAAVTTGMASTSGFFAWLDEIDDRLSRLKSVLDGIHDERDYWSRVRDEFQFDKELVYLNCGSIGTCPKIVTDALIGYARRVETNPFREVFGAGLASNLLGAEIGHRVLGRGNGRNWDYEQHHAGHECDCGWFGTEAGRRDYHDQSRASGGNGLLAILGKAPCAKIVYVTLPEQLSDPQAIVGSVADKVTVRTRVFSFCHVDTITGMVLPIADIARLARQKGIFFVCDGAAPGMLAVGVKSLGVDAYATSSHKWMLAPKGSGLLYIAQDASSRVHPMQFYSGFSTYSASSGTCDVARVLAHGVAIQFQNVIGRQRIENRVRELSQRLSSGLSHLGARRRLTPEPREFSSGIVTFAVDRSRATSTDIQSGLEREHQIYVKAAQGTFAAVADPKVSPEDYNALRFSTHFMNSDADIDKTIDALERRLR